jgi:hypothetical protein
VTKQAHNGNRNRKHLEAEAEQVRSELMERVSQLDERRDRVVRAVKSVTKPPLSIALLVVAGAAATVFVAYRLHRSRRRPLERLAEAWLAPLEPPRPPSLLASTLKRSLISAAAKGLEEIGRRSVDRLLAVPPGDVDDRPVSASTA